MTWERIIRWRCDSCGTTAEKNGYGFVKGWSAVPSDPKNIHALQNRVTLNECPECTHKRMAKVPFTPAFIDWYWRNAPKTVVLRMVLDDALAQPGDEQERRELSAAEDFDRFAMGPRDDESTAEWADRIRAEPASTEKT